MIGLYLGRFQPLHIMHEYVISELIKDFGYDNSCIIIGSASSSNDKNIFSYDERKKMIQNIYPEMKNIFPLNDYMDDNVWLRKFYEIILNNFNFIKGPEDVVIYCGCFEDVIFFKNSGFKIKTFERKISSSDNISATKIREAIINNNVEYIKSMINIKNLELVLSKNRGI